MMDELRFVNFSVAKSGASYTPTTVPHDTNSVLILPDGTVPIADEYWKWDRTITPVYSLDTTTGYLNLPASNCTNGGAPYGGWDRSTWARGQVLVSTSNSVQVADGFSTFSCGNASSSGGFGLYINQYARISDRGIAICLDVASGASCSALAYYNDTYTFTLVDRSGKRYSLTCTVSDRDSSWSSSFATFEWGRFQFSRLYCNTIGAFLYLDINPNTSLDIVYLEAVRGSVPNTGHEFVNCLYPADEMKPNTAAVQSDIPINGYTVGGVRPTFPARGDVWFPVNGSRISGCYIYNGRAWEETNARWYTGTRWIPIYAFDIITLEDMWDIADAPETVPSINSEHGFWNWWQSTWLDFRGWLSSAWGSGSGGPGGSSGGGSGSVDDSTFEPVPPPGEDPESSGWSFLDLLVAIKDGAWSITVGTVSAVFGGVTGIITAVGSIGDYYDAYDSDNPDGIFGITNYEGADIWD